MGLVSVEAVIGLLLTEASSIEVFAEPAVSFKATDYCISINSLKRSTVWSSPDILSISICFILRDLIKS